MEVDVMLYFLGLYGLNTPKKKWQLWGIAARGIQNKNERECKLKTVTKILQVYLKDFFSGKDLRCYNCVCIQVF